MNIILTSNFRGGILQFSEQILSTVEKLYGESLIFVPFESECKTDKCRYYVRKNSLSIRGEIYKEIAKEIMSYNPQFIFACDSDYITSRIIKFIDKRIPVVMVVHDVNTHPYYNSYIYFLKNQIKYPYILKAWRRADKIILLSDSTKQKFENKYGQFKDKVNVMRLSAHVPNVDEKAPMELLNEKDYFLFFGRLEKYKGIINLLKAYESKKSQITHKVVIAGDGILTAEEERIIENNKEGIVLVKRFIEDSEMLWLFRNAYMVVLPYIEASQSGVIPIAYHFSKPVIVSNVDGLTEFVDDKSTGYIYTSLNELADILVRVDQAEPNIKNNIDEFYEKKLNWEINVQNCMRDIVRDE